MGTNVRDSESELAADRNAHTGHRTGLRCQVRLLWIRSASPSFAPVKPAVPEPAIYVLLKYSTSASALCPIRRPHNHSRRQRNGGIVPIAPTVLRAYTTGGGIHEKVSSGAYTTGGDIHEKVSSGRSTGVMPTAC
ncbi:hypothetical protein SBA4_270007 [Candidatus Sulfopaludibacter sp. SbA4]|nr:hypothetical protein SBA4_270007 [Candidatus Sulfopaludibacter sp. SbA4]